jgi:hypothetical protein
MENKKYHCEYCNYYSNFNSEWLKHLQSQKHQRYGEKKSKKCNICDYEASSHWNIKIHVLSQHSTIDEKKQYKYYCEICEQIFFSSKHFKSHVSGKKHENVMKIKELDINNKIR